MAIVRGSHVFMMVLYLIAVQSVPAQDQSAAGNQAAQQRVAELRQSLAANQAKLKTYQWTQITEVSVKGETKKDEQAQCRYGADGKIQKTKIGSPDEPKQMPGGLKGKIAKKKIGEMKDYMDRLKSLVGHSAPPDPQTIKAATQAGRANVDASAGQTTITVHNYYKQGDQVAFGFDTAANKVTSYNVNTYLDDPKKDVVTLTNQFASLPDGTNYLQKTVLKAEGKQIQITTTNSGYGPAQ